MKKKKKNVIFKNCLQKGSLGNLKWIYIISAKKTQKKLEIFIFKCVKNLLCIWRGHRCQ